MTEIPQRISLSSQLVVILKRGILRGEWTQFMPGEHALCRSLKVSRTTLRTALSALRREGLIEVSQGRRVRVIARPRVGDVPSRPRSVAILAAQPYHTLSPFALSLIATLQDDFHEHAYKLQVVADPRFGSAHPSRSLTHLVASVAADVWILLRPTQPCVQWFAARQLDAISVTDTPDDRTTRAVYVDSAAAVRHAVNLLVKRGYRRVAFLDRDTEAPGQASLERAFREAALATVPGVADRPLVLRYPPRVDEIPKTIDRLLARPFPCTGLLVAVPKDTITVVCHLANSRIRVPQEVGLISLGHFSQMDALLPAVAHYSFDWRRFAKRVSSAVRLLLTAGELPQRQIGILPEFVEGESLLPAR